MLSQETIFSGGRVVKNWSQCKRCGFDPWLRKTSEGNGNPIHSILAWKYFRFIERAWQGHKELDTLMTEHHTEEGVCGAVCAQFESRVLVEVGDLGLNVGSVSRQTVVEAERRDKLTKGVS